MTEFKYSIAGINYEEAGKFLQENQDNIWNAINTYLKKEFRNTDILNDLIDEIIKAAEWSIGSTYDFGPDKNDKKWKGILKQLKTTKNALLTIKTLELSYLDIELRTQDSFINYCENSKGSPYYKVYTDREGYKRYGDKYIELSRVVKAANNYVSELHYLLSKSLKGNKVGGKKTNDHLVKYCFSISRCFKKYTGKEAKLNGPFEKFFDECIKPFRNTTFKEYSSSSATNAIRKLQTKLDKKKKL